MNIKLNDKNIISEIEYKGIKVPFCDMDCVLYYKKNGEQISLDLPYYVEYAENEDMLTVTVKIKNDSDTDFTPEAIGFRIGIDSYMESYPEWNDKFFPSYLRCEKTHFTGYFMSPLGKIAVVTCDGPVAAWELEYNKWGTEDEMNCHFGHRIYTADLLLTVNDKLPERHPKITGIKANEEKVWNIKIAVSDGIENYKNIVCEKFGLPVLDFEKYTVAKGESARLNVLCNEEYTVSVISPSGKTVEGTEFIPDEYGVYTATVTTKSGKVSEAKLYCRHDYGWYMKAARKNAVYKPQKATTHTESWYGHFSGFLAKKHYPDSKLDKLIKANFDEIMPIMYDFENGEALVDPERVQNTSALISLLVDVYEAEKDEKYLDYANNMAGFLMKRQDESGAYKSGNTHYTSVIYVAKSMLELALCEKECGKTERYKKHYDSAKRAVWDLQNLVERIGTEGEHTLEDGMITCSALQLCYFALTLDESERQPFIDVAEHLMSIHKCLEELVTPDCRMRGATLRFWEAQYDVLIRGNMMNTPHGWTSWKNYATYYLYLLTGKEEYLKDTFDTMGACLQMVDENENLRWAFITDPYNKVKVMIPDTDEPVKDGYASVPSDIESAYRGKYVEKTFGEEYVDMISGWYRMGEQKITGGYLISGFPYNGTYKTYKEMDNQGGACDNDVHEHFKCLEETLLKKAFLVNKNGVRGYNCSVKDSDLTEVIPYGECEYLHINTDCDITVKICGKTINAKRGLKMIKIG